MTTLPVSKEIGNAQASQYKIGFIMDMVAGHVTHYRNLRRVVEQDAAIQPAWNEVVYNKPNGLPEKLQARFSFVPYYPIGISRAGSVMFHALHKNNYDGIYINSRVAVFFSRYFRRTPTIFDTDVTPVQLDKLEGYAGKEDVGAVAKFKHKLFRDFVHSTRLVITWSEWARQSFINDYGLPPERVVINPPGVNLDYWQPGSHPAAVEAQKPVRILFVGGDFRRKGGELLLEWFARQPQGLCELDIVTREPVEARPGIKLHYNMQPNSPELLHLYQMADIFILPSAGECFGIATLEAMACGLPVIQTSVGGVADIIQPGLNGFIIPPKDLKAMDDALQILLADPGKRQQMGKAGRFIVEQKFDVTTNAKRSIAYLKQFSRQPSNVA